MFKCKVPKVLEDIWTLKSLIEKVGRLVTNPKPEDRRILRKRNFALVAMRKDGEEAIVVTRHSVFEMLIGATSTNHTIWYAIPRDKVCDIADEHGVPLRLKNFREGW